MEEKPGGGLRNTIYEHQTRSGRRLTPARLLLYKMVVPLGLSLLRLVWRWSPVVRIIGSEHIPAALARAPSFIPVYWHQHLLFCVKHLLDQRSAGLKLGFLISPSVDGEIGAMIVRSVGAEVIRGSSTHTGRARAARLLSGAGTRWRLSGDYTGRSTWAALEVQAGRSLSGRPMIPLCYAASRAWLIKWDRFVILSPWHVSLLPWVSRLRAQGTQRRRLESLQADMETRLKALFEEARSGLR